MNRCWMLLKREYWENRGAFFWTPVVVSALLFVLMVIAVVSVKVGIAETNQEFLTHAGDGLQKFASSPIEVRTKVIGMALLQPAQLLSFVMFIVLFFYLLGSLFDDRKDRSILFWKSLPVSDVETVLSKLVMALFAGPMIYVVFITILQVAMLVLFSIGASMVADVPVWSTFWAPSSLHMIILLSVLGFFYYALWWLPFAGWLLFASALARRAPFLYAVVPPALVVLGEMLFDWFGLIDTDGMAVLSWLGNQMSGGIVDSMTEENLQRLLLLPLDELVVSIMHPGNLANPPLIIGVLVGLALVYGAIVLRRYYPEI
jgi:ABC-2 type transport system permease protein